MPDAVLEQYWANHVWVCSDSALSGRDKALIAFGAAGGLTPGRVSLCGSALFSTGAGRQHWTTRAWLRLPTGVLRLCGANGLARVPVEPEHHAVLYTV